MKYDFKTLEELAWGAAVAALTFALTALVASDSVTDWRPWLVGVLAGAGRAAAGYVLSRIGGGATKPV